MIKRLWRLPAKEVEQAANFLHRNSVLRRDQLVRFVQGGIHVAFLNEPIDDLHDMTLQPLHHRFSLLVEPQLLPSLRTGRWPGIRDAGRFSNTIHLQTHPLQRTEWRRECGKRSGCLYYQARNIALWLPSVDRDRSSSPRQLDKVQGIVGRTNPPYANLSAILLRLLPPSWRKFRSETSRRSQCLLMASVYVEVDNFLHLRRCL